MDTDDLRDLAGRPARANPFEMTDLLHRVFDQLRLEFPEEKTGRAFLVALDFMCEQFLEGRITPRDLTAWAHEHVGHDGPDLAQPLVEHDDDSYSEPEKDWQFAAKVHAHDFRDGLRGLKGSAPEK